MRMTVAAVGLGLLALACGGQGRVTPAPKPVAPAPAAPRVEGATNVLLVVLDDVGVDKVGTFDPRHDPPPTPTLDRLSREGVRFTRTWAHPMCSPTRASILTGRYARRTGLGAIIDSWKDEPELAESEITIPEMLGRASARWDTSMVGKWHLGTRRGDPATHPGRQGFAWWAGTLGNLRDDWNGDKGGRFGYTRWMKNDNGRVQEATGYVTTDSANDAIARIGAMQEPWFLYLAFNAAHFPTHVPPANLADTRGLTERSPEIDLYDATVEAVDKELGRVLDAMDPKLRARTTVMVVGDNGTTDYGVRPPQDPERAKGSLYELGIHVPLIVTGPFVGRAGAESDALVHTADLFSTVAEIAGVPLSSLDRKIDGISLLPLLRDPGAASLRKFLYSEKFSPNGPGPAKRDTVAVRNARYKLIAEHKVDGSTEEWLYDLGERDAEGRNLLAGKGPNADQRAAHQQLNAELQRIAADLR